MQVLCRGGPRARSCHMPQRSAMAPEHGGRHRQGRAGEPEVSET
jgi:hypothetical protein